MKFLTMTRIGQYGRLGNQLFQYAALLGISSKTRLPVRIPDLEFSVSQGVRSDLRFFDLVAEKLRSSDYENGWEVYEENSATGFCEDVFHISETTNLVGYFQDLRYFRHIDGVVRTKLVPKATYTDEGRSFVERYRDIYKGRTVVSLHVRRGDNIYFGDERLLGIYNESGFAMDYYRRALEKFNDIEIVLLIFTGGARGQLGYLGQLASMGERVLNRMFKVDGSPNELQTSNGVWRKLVIRLRAYLRRVVSTQTIPVKESDDDYAWCETMFSNVCHEVIKGRSSIQDFCAIMHCDHHILSPASSFGWWAAYLGSFERTKRVVAPKNYSPDDEAVYYTRDYYPKDWIVI